MLSILSDASEQNTFSRGFHCLWGWALIPSSTWDSWGRRVQARSSHAEQGHLAGFVHSDPLWRIQSLLSAIRHSRLFCCCRNCASREALGCAQWLRYHVCDGLCPVPCAQPSWQKGAGNPALASTRVQWALAWRAKGFPFLTNLPFSVKSCLTRRWQWSLAPPSAIQELPLSPLPDIIKTSVFLSTFSE